MMKYGKHLFALVVVVAVAIIFLVGTRESAVSIRNQDLKISGMYGTEIQFQDISKVELRQTLPSIKRRTNGMDFMGTYKGMFNLEDFGRSRLFVHSTEGPYLIIHTDEETIVINFKDEAKTRKLQADINSAMGN